MHEDKGRPTSLNAWSLSEHVLRFRAPEHHGSGRRSTREEVSCRPKPSLALQRYYCGELTQEQYLEERIILATAHLRGKISQRKFERIRRIVKRICASDPLFLAIKARLFDKPSKRRR